MTTTLNTLPLVAALALIGCAPSAERDAAPAKPAAESTNTTESKEVTATTEKAPAAAAANATVSVKGMGSPFG